MSRKDVHISNKLSPVLILGAVVVVVLIVGAAYFLSSSPGEGPQTEPETPEEPVVEESADNESETEESEINAPEIEEPGRVVNQSNVSESNVSESTSNISTQITTSDAELRSVENNTLTFVRGDDVLTVKYGQTGGVSLRKKDGPRFLRISPEEIPLGSTVRLYASFVNGTEVITTVLYVE